MYELSYHRVDNHTHPTELTFKTIVDFRNWVEQKVNNVMFEKGVYIPSDRVYLFTYDNINPKDKKQTEVWVTESVFLICDMLTQYHFFGFDLIRRFYLQEYESYEDAYAVALTMKEDSHLCYGKQDENA